MSKRMIGILLTLAMTLTLFGIGVVSASADDVATITVGGKTYTASVGENVEYTISFSYTGNKLATAQVELPVDFSILDGYTQEEIDANLSIAAPNTAASSVVLRSDGNNTLGLTGYVMNFVSAGGYAFNTQKAVLSIVFRVEKAGAYTLAAKVRHVDDINGNTVVDGAYHVTDSKFSYSESLNYVMLDTPKLTVATAAGGMRISWDPVPRASVYRVYYKGSKGWTRLIDTEETSVLDTDVVSGTRYTYTVRCLSPDKTRFVSSYDLDGESAVYYTAPTLTLSNAADGVKLSWNVVSGAAKYRLYYKGSKGWTKLADTASTSYTDTDVSSGTRYTYTIRCMDSSNNHISWYYADGFSITYIAAPTFSVSNAADGVKISWPAVKGAAKYRVFYKNSKGNWARLADTAETSVIDTDVSSNHTYTYTVRCITEDGESYTSYFRSGKSVKYIAAPKLTLTNAADSVSISWSAVAGASKYRVYYKNNGSWTRLTDTASTSCSHTNLTSGAAYTYTIRCLDSSGNLISWYYADGFSITYLTAPTVSVSNAADGVKISWNAVSGAEKYRVYYYGSRGWTKLADTTDTSFIDTDVSSNHTYTYTVRCINADANAFTSYFRSGKSVKYYAAPKLTLTNTTNGVSLQWSAVSGAAKYRIYYKGANGWTRLTDTASTSYTDTSVSKGASRTYTIRCMDSSSNLISWYYADGFTITYQSF